MLVIAKSLRELRFGELMKVYEESLAQTALEQQGIPAGLALEMAEQDVYQYLHRDFFSREQAFCGLWQIDGKYVSALRMEPYRDGLLLTSLETAVAARGNGYAHALIRGVQDFLKGNGSCRVYSHVSKDNGASMSVHVDCGFCRISDCAVYLDGSVDSRCVTLCWEVK